MNFTKKIDFTLEGVDGNLMLSQTPFGIRLYQNGVRVKKKGILYRFDVQTTDGGMEPLKVKHEGGTRLSVNFRNTHKYLEEKLKPLEYFLGLLPLLLIFRGGAIGGFFAVLGCWLLINYMRVEKNVTLQILVSLGVTTVCILCWLAVSSAILSGVYSIQYLFGR